MEQGTAQWLELRRTKIGASDAPVIMGQSPWNTPYGLWMEKLGLKEKPKTQAMQFGLKNEENVRWILMERKGILVSPEVIISNKRPWMMASLDGIDETRRFIVEIKSANAEDHAIANAGGVPEKYKHQLLHQLEVTELPMAWYCSWHKGEVAIVEFLYEPEEAKRMVKEEEEFFRCMEEMEAPRLCDRDYVEREDCEWIEKAKEWLSVHRRVRELSVLENVLRKDLIALAGSSNSKGAGIRLSKGYRQGAIDWKMAEKELEMSLQKFRKEGSETWRLTDEETT